MSAERSSANDAPAASGRERVSVVIQAGGESRRMGQDKAHVPFLGRPMIEHVIERVASIADEIVITSNAPQKLTHLGLSVFPDVTQNRGALNGFLTALSIARYEIVCIIACDMVFANAEMLAAEIELLRQTGADAVVPTTSHGYEPFHSAYRRIPCLKAVEEALEAGERRAYEWYPRIRVVEFGQDQIAKYYAEGGAFLNVNTPEQLAAAEEVALRRAASHAEAEASPVEASPKAAHTPKPFTVSDGFSAQPS
ncbi:MAG: molybdenum cofactor guanylyltransferase [Coriobacteriia bacterium]